MTTAAHARQVGTYDRDSLEFARVANLADALFAIAMTLLVLGIEVDAVGAGRVAAGLAEVVPNLVAFALGFALVANIWWQHHKFVARLGSLDRPLIALTVALLGVVALVPFPTGLLGEQPTDRAAVLAFIAVFVVLLVLFVACVWRAQRAGAWVTPMPARTFRWVIAGFLVTIAVMLVAGVVAWRWPVAGLAVLALSNLPEVVLARRAPDDYRDWS
jgi:uncharacterized membrane protein